MVELTRCVRFCVNDNPEGGTGSPDNTFAAYPSMRGLGRFYELRVRCRGTPDPKTGYFLNIKEIDQAVRREAVPRIERACREQPRMSPAALLRDVLPGLNDALKGTVRAVRWQLTPYHSIEMTTAATHTRSTTQATVGEAGAGAKVLLRQQFEFAASHRLHCPHLSDEQNRSMFGKCNSPSGHGHNYRIEPCVESPVGREGAAIELAAIERLTARLVIDRFDHKHLNLDTPEFDVEKGGLNPSVENIARVCYDLLAPAIRQECPEAKLKSVTVWETDKTWCTYPAGE